MNHFYRMQYSATAIAAGKNLDVSFYSGVNNEAQNVYLLFC